MVAYFQRIGTGLGQNYRHGAVLGTSHKKRALADALNSMFYPNNFYLISESDPGDVGFVGLFVFVFPGARFIMFEVRNGSYSVFRPYPKDPGVLVEGPFAGVQIPGSFSVRIGRPRKKHHRQDQYEGKCQYFE